MPKVTKCIVTIEMEWGSWYHDNENDMADLEEEKAYPWTEQLKRFEEYKYTSDFFLEKSIPVKIEYREVEE